MQIASSTVSEKSFSDAMLAYDPARYAYTFARCVSVRSWHWSLRYSRLARLGEQCGKALWFRFVFFIVSLFLVCLFSSAVTNRARRALARRTFRQVSYAARRAKNRVWFFDVSDL